MRPSPAPHANSACRIPLWMAILVVSTAWGCGSDSKSVADIAAPTDVAELTTDVAPSDTQPLDQTSADLQEEVIPLPPPDSLWLPGPTALDWPAWVNDRGWMKEVSSWSHQLDQTPGNPADLRQFMDLALGNGTLFSMTGYKGPFDRLHGMVGPTYQKSESFFSDTWLEMVRESGQVSSWRKEWLGRIQLTPIVWTQSLDASFVLSTVSAALLPAEADSPLLNAIIRVVVVKNRTDAPVQNARLVIRFARPQEAETDRVFERQEEQRRTVLVLSGETATPGAQELSVELPEIAAGGEHVLRLAYVVDKDDAQRESVLAAMADLDFDKAFAETRDSWQARMAKATQIETPDPMVNQYLQQALMVILSQTAHEGSICPMSQYTRFWVRDAAGPIRFLIRMGLFEESRKALDYLWAAALRTGGAKNSYDADIDPLPPFPEQPDWENLDQFSGHARAETPSHVPLMHYWYWAASGVDDFLSERFGMMEYNLTKQAFEGDLLPFSGDETYRTAMAICHDLELTEEFVEGFYSSFSSLIWVVGAEALATMYQSKGETGKAEALRTRAQEVRTKAEQVFRRSDGAWVPYVASADLTQSSKLFEDVSMKPIWFAYESPTSEAGRKNLKVAIEEIGGEDGILVTQLPDSFEGILGLPVTQGVYTGMNPGYYLWTLAASQHPLAEAAFNAMKKHATATGTHPEYQILDDFSPLHLLYSDIGATPSDYTARYRPWEGGVNADAVVYYLLGITQDAWAHKLGLAPHLPNGWSWLNAKGIRVGESRVDLSLKHPTADSWLVDLKVLSGPAVTVELTLPADAESATVVINGTAATVAVEDSGWGTKLLKVDAVELLP